MVATDTIPQSFANPLLVEKDTVSQHVLSMLFDKFLIICSHFSLLFLSILAEFLFLLLAKKCSAMIILSLLAYPIDKLSCPFCQN